MGYSAQTFVADEQPTTAKWNLLWSNDASFNDGTGIGTNAIGAANLATDAIVLGQTTKTASQDSTSTTHADITSLPLTVTVPSGGRDLLLVLMGHFGSSAAGVNHQIKFWDGAVTSGTLLRDFIIGSGYANVGIIFPYSMSCLISAPAAGSKTYRASMASTSGTFRIYGSSTIYASFSAYLV